MPAAHWRDLPVTQFFYAAFSHEDGRRSPGSPRRKRRQQIVDASFASSSNNAGTAAFLRDSLGVELCSVGGKHCVFSVLERSPAAREGLKTNDVILKVGGLCPCQIYDNIALTDKRMLSALL